jgi:hypothetical protein
VLRGAQHTLHPGMIGGQGSLGGSTEVKGSVGARLRQCCPEALRVAEMSNVACTFTGLHLTHSQKHIRRRTHAPSPATFATGTASQATSREKDLIKVQKRGEGCEPSRFHFPASDYTSGPQTSIPNFRTGRITECMMRSFAATLMREDISTTAKPEMLPSHFGRGWLCAYPKTKHS